MNPLNQLTIFKNVKEGTVDRIWSAGRVMTYEKYDLIFRGKEPCNHIFLQMSGKTIVYSLTHTGKRKILFVFGRDNLLNDDVLKTHSFSFYCEAIEKSEVFKIPVNQFFACMEQDFSLTKAVLAAQERKIWRLGHQLKNTVGSIYMERKLAAKLWKLSRDFGIPKKDGIEIDMNLSITFLADMLGVPRETASKTSSTLVRYGLIAMDKKRITVVDPKRMAEFYKKGVITKIE